MFQSLRIASRSAGLALVAALLACLPLSAMAATGASRGDIVVVTVHGTVSATMAGMTAPLSAGAILQLPVTVRTGADGAVELRQGTSTFAAAGNTELEIPESAAQDGLVERIVQIRGNAFYNIGKRTGTRLRVEAPYLVAVIKGTQFNVAAQEDSTTIALFEGHLEVRASDDSDVVDLNAGEIAIRRRNDVSISVLRLNAARGDVRRNQELAARPQSDSPSSSSGTVTARNDSSASRPRLDTTTPTLGVSPGNSERPTQTERGSIIETLPDSSVAVVAKPAVDVGSVTADVNTSVSVDVPAGIVEVNAGATAAVGEVASVDAGVSAAVDLGSGTATAGADVGVDVGSVRADVGAGASVDIPAGAVDVDVGASVGVGEVASVDTALSTGVDLGAGTVAASSDVGADVGSVSADVGAGASVDVPGGAVDVGAGATVAAGDVAALDVGVAAAVDVPAGTVDVGVDTSVASTDVGATVGVDAGAGNIGADVNVGPIDVGLDVGSGGLDLDLGLGASDDSGGGLLGGLLGRKRRD